MVNSIRMSEEALHVLDHVRPARMLTASFGECISESVEYVFHVLGFMSYEKSWDMELQRHMVRRRLASET